MPLSPSAKQAMCPFEGSPVTVTKEPVSVSLDWIMDTYKVRGDRTFGVGDLKFLLSEGQRREVTSPECIQAMQTKRLQANRPGEKRKAQGAIDVGWTCFAQPGKFRWYFTLFGKALSRNELYALKPTNMKKVKCHCVMYKRKGNPLLDSPLGPIIRSWIWGVECVLKMWDARHYNAMHTVCQPVTLNTGEVFDVRIPGVRDNVLFNFTLNHHTYPACEFGKPQSEAIISLHRDTQDFHAGIAATTDGIGPDPESLEGGSFHLYDGPFTQKASMKRGRDGKNIKVKVSDLPDPKRLVDKPVGQTALGTLHTIWHYVSPGNLKKSIDATRWSFIAQQKQDVIEQLAAFRRNPDVWIVTSEAKNNLRAEGVIPPKK